MLQEVECAAMWITNLMEVSMVSFEALQTFQATLQQMLLHRFHGHWYASHPVRGQAYRSIMIDPENNYIDDVIRAAADVAGIEMVDHRFFVKNGIQVWIDPGEVMCGTVRGKSVSMIVYKDGRMMQANPNSLLRKAEQAHSAYEGARYSSNFSTENTHQQLMSNLSRRQQKRRR